MGQLVEKGYKVLFNNDYCLIKDQFIMEVKGKSFVLNPLKEERIAFPMT